MKKKTANALEDLAHICINNTTMLAAGVEPAVLKEFVRCVASAREALEDERMREWDN